MTTETKVEAVDILRYHEELYGMVAGLALYEGQPEYVLYADHAAAIAALEGKVERWKTRYDDAMRARADEQKRADAAERRVAEVYGALRVALASIDETCKEMTLGDRFTNAGQSLIDAIPVCRAALTKESP